MSVEPLVSIRTGLGGSESSEGGCLLAVVPDESAVEVGKLPKKHWSRMSSKYTNTKRFRKSWSMLFTNAWTTVGRWLVHLA